MVDEKEELFQIYKTLEKHGIIVDQIDYDDDGRPLWRWLIKWSESDTQESVEQWHTPAQALDAALSVLLVD